MFSRMIGWPFAAWWLGAALIGCRDEQRAGASRASIDSPPATEKAAQAAQPPSPTGLTVLLDTKGLSINGTRVATPPTVDQLVKILGEPERKPQGDIVYDRYGMIFTASSSVMQIFLEPLRDPQGIFPTAPFIGTLSLGDYRVQTTSELADVQAKASAFQFRDPNPGLVPDHPGLSGRAGPIHVSVSWTRDRLRSVALHLKPRPQ